MLVNILVKKVTAFLKKKCIYIYFSFKEQRAHALLNGLGVVLGSDERGEDKTLFVTLSGWFFAKYSEQEISSQGRWLPATPSRPRTYYHKELLGLSTALLEGMQSVESIIAVIEKLHVDSPPPSWKSNFGEALRLFASMQIMMKHGVFNFKKNFRKRTICPVRNPT